MDLKQILDKMTQNTETTKKYSSTRNWCFTINNYNDEHIEHLNKLIADKKDYKINKLGYNQEIGEKTGTPHIQGFITFIGVKAMKGVKKILNCNWVHLEPMRGSIKDNIDYCSKSETRIEGTNPILSIDDNQGERVDWIPVRESIRQNGFDNTILNDEFADKTMPYMKACETFDKVYKTDILKKAALEDYENFVLRPWQQKIVDIIEKPADSRTINWIWESKGNIGKSELMNYLCIKHNAIELEGKKADMAFMYNGEPIVCFDIPRTAEDNNQESIRHLYNFAEKLKNKRIVSTKYESRQKIFKQPHIIFFANFECDKTAWSEDRYNIIDLNYLHEKPHNPKTLRDSENHMENITDEKPYNFETRAYDSETEKIKTETSAKNAHSKNLTRSSLGNTKLGNLSDFDNVESELLVNKDIKNITNTNNVDINNIEPANDNIQYIEWDDIEQKWLDNTGNIYSCMAAIPDKYIDIEKSSITIKPKYRKHNVVKSKQFNKQSKILRKELIPEEGEIDYYINHNNEFTIYKLDKYYRRLDDMNKKYNLMYKEWSQYDPILKNKINKIPPFMKPMYEQWIIHDLKN